MASATNVVVTSGTGHVHTREVTVTLAVVAG